MTRLLRRAGGTLKRWSQPIADEHKRERRNDRAHALILCNLIFAVIVVVCFFVEVQGHVDGEPYFYFWGGQVFVVFAYGVNSHLTRSLPAGWDRLFSSARSESSDPDDQADEEDEEEQESALAGFSIPVDLIGAVNALLVGYLTYYTGGPSDSPYAQVLVAVLLIAEQTRRVRQANHGRKLRRMIRHAFNEFKTFLAITLCFYIPLGVLQWRYPVHVATAPAGVTIAITLIIFGVGTVANYLGGASRRAKPAKRASSP